MKIVNICATDLNDVAGGGIATYVRELIKSSDSGVEVSSIGFTAHRSQERVGAWNCREAGRGKRYQFLPLFATKAAGNDRLSVPLNLRLLLALSSGKTRLIPPDASLQVHRVELALPLVIGRKRFPTVLTIHGASKFMEFCPDHPLYSRKWFRECFYRVEGLVLSRVEKTILVTREGYDYYLSKYPSLRNAFVHIPVGVDTEFFKPMNRLDLRKKYGFSQAAQILLYAGRLVPEKGLSLLIQAFSELIPCFPNSRLLIVGEGECERGLMREVAQRRLSQVKFLGGVSHQLLPELINCADTVVLPSLFEGLPTVMLESLACGVPVVSTRVGDATHIIEEGETGFLVARRDAGELKETMALALKQGRKMRDNCVQAAQDYSSRLVAGKVIDVHREVYHRFYRNRLH